MVTRAQNIHPNRFVYLCFIVFGIIVAPSVGNAASGQTSARFSSVLAQGQKLGEGLTSLTTAPNGIYGSFESEGRTIYFETRRGPRTPKYLRDGDAATPKFEIDVRFMNQDGQPFLTKIGGDTPLDPTWTEDIPVIKTDAEAKIEFKMAAKAIEAMRKLEFSRKFVHERKALVDLSPVVESAQVVELVEGEPSQALSGPTLLATNTYRHRVEIHHKSCCFGLARHSATIGKYISSSGVTTTAHITCNHGTCADQMALKCSWTSAKPGNRTNRVRNWVTCSTWYNALSILGHNSNDDTDLQYRAVRYDFIPDRTGGICNDSSVNNEPTDCY